jgi:DNA-binding MarR family transcriptional regulator
MVEAIHREIPHLLDLHIAPYRLSELAWHALKSIEEFGAGATLTAIGERIEASPSTMTGIANRLEQLGYVERRPSPHDRRAAILTCTERGKEVMDEIDSALLESIERMTEDLGREEIQAITRAFRRILDVTSMLTRGGSPSRTGRVAPGRS